MVVNLYDYEVLARQKHEAMLAEAEQRRGLAGQDRESRGRRNSLRAVVGGLRARLGAAEAASVSTRTA
jgi:hypothetical protein